MIGKKKTIEIDFTPQRILEIRRTKKIRILITGAVIFCIVIMSIPPLYFRYQSNKNESQLSILEKRSAKDNKIKDQLANSENMINEKSKIYNDYKSIFDKSVSMTSLMDRLEKVVPEDVWFQSLNIIYADDNVLKSEDDGKGIKTGQIGPQEMKDTENQPKPKNQKSDSAVDGKSVTPANPQVLSSAGGTEAADRKMPNCIEISGYSTDSKSIGVFINKLRKVPGFKKVNFKGIQAAQGQLLYSFKLDVIFNLKEGG